MIEAVRRLRNYRDSVGRAGRGARSRRASSGDAYEGSLRRDRPPRAVRPRPCDGGDGEVVSSIGLEGATVEVLPSDTVDPAEARARIEAERDRLRAEIETGARQARQQGLHGQGAAGAGAGRAREARALRGRAGRAGGVDDGGAPETLAPRARGGALPASLELFGMRFGLERMRRLMTALDSPQERFALDPRRGHERQVLDGAHDRRAAASAHGLRDRRLPVAAPGLVRRARRGRRQRRSPTSASRRRSRAPPRRRRWSTARSSRATA